MPLLSSINKNIPMVNTQLEMPNQLNWLLTTMSNLEGEPKKDIINRILSKAAFEFFRNMQMIDILRGRYKDKFGMPWVDDFFGEEVNPMGVENVEEFEEDLLAAEETD